MASAGHADGGAQTLAQVDAQFEFAEMPRPTQFRHALAILGMNVGVAGANDAPRAANAAIDVRGKRQFGALALALAAQVAGREGAMLGVEEEAVDLPAQRTVECRERQRTAVEAPLDADFDAVGRLRPQIGIADERIRRVAEAFHEGRVLDAAPDAGEPARLAKARDADAVREGVGELVVEVAADGSGEAQARQMQLVFAGDAEGESTLALIGVAEGRCRRSLLEALGFELRGGVEALAPERQVAGQSRGVASP